MVPRGRRIAAACAVFAAAGCVDFQNAQDAFCAKRPELCSASTLDGGNASDSGGTGDGGKTVDGGTRDAGASDGGDGGAGDAGLFDAGPPVCTVACSPDGGLPDGGALPPHMIYTCIANDTCGIACAALWGDCNGDAGDGCEMPVGNDTLNCGACGHRCGNANTASAPTCTGGTCNITCLTNYANCDGLDQTGCEAALWADPSNCGVCGFACPAGISCVNGGACKLTGDSESVFSTVGNDNVLLADSASLYWINNSPWQIRAMNKDGTSLRTLYWGDAGLVELPPIYGPFLAVDATNIYTVADPTTPAIYRGDKVLGDQSGATPVRLISTSGMLYMQSIHLDVPSTSASVAGHVSWAIRNANAGIYRYTVADAGIGYIDLSVGGDPGAFSQHGAELYWGYGTSLEFRKIDLSAPAPAAQVLTTSGGITFYATAADGQNLFFFSSSSPCCDLYMIDSFKNRSVMSHCPATGNGSFNLATDGQNVYMAGGDLWKAPINAAGSTCISLVPHSALFGSTNQMLGLVVDTDSVYFATQNNIYKSHL